MESKSSIDGKECGIVKFNVIKDDKYIDSGFRIKYVFYDPKGNYYTDVFIDIKSIKVNEESWAWGSIKIKGFPLENKPGEWKCKVYFEEDLVKEISFIIE